MGTVALAEAVLRHAGHCRFVLASSAEIYGLSFRAAAPLDEEAPLRPANPYAASKAACDLAVGEMALRGLDAVRLQGLQPDRRRPVRKLRGSELRPADRADRGGGSRRR